MPAMRSNAPGSVISIREPVLFLVRSPFQATLVERIVADERISTFDCIYYNPALNAKDKTYFARLQAKARHAILLSRESPLGWYHFLRIASYKHGAVFFGNHTFSVFRRLVSAKRGASIYSFDEGGGNFDPHGALQQDRRKWVERLRDGAMNAPPAGKLFAKVEAHFTVDVRMQNVVPPEKLRQVNFGSENTAISSVEPINILIGQPYEEYLLPDQVELLFNAYREVPGSLYAPHPRENFDRLPRQFKLLMDDRIIEEVIYAFRGEGHLVRVIGCSTTVFASIHGEGIEKYSLEPTEKKDRITRMRQLGCDAFHIVKPADRERWTMLTKSWSDPGQVEWKPQS